MRIIYCNYVWIETTLEVLALLICIMLNNYAQHDEVTRLFRYQHVGMGNAKRSCLGSKPMRMGSRSDGI